MRIALGLSYDGTSFFGWQTQPNVQTVQDTLEAALASFLAEPVTTICSGRTDTGVHALGQVVHLDTQASRSPESWVRGLNALLPGSVAVQWAIPVSETFHARFSATARTYIYVLRNDRVRSPFLKNKAGWEYRSLDLEAMRAGAKCLLGKNDFSSFRSSQCQASHPVRTMQHVGIDQQGPLLIFTFRANAFLHHMIRNIMGALVYVGLGRHEPDWIADLVALRDRRHAAPTYPSSGLYLAHAHYPAEFSLPASSVRSRLYTLTGIQLGER